MSVEKNSYTILGYDLTQYKDKILTEEFHDSEEYDNLVCYHRIGKIQLFDDPMSGDYLYYGYIISSREQYGDSDADKFQIGDIQDIKDKVDKEFDFIKLIGRVMVPFEVIAFDEYT